MIDTRLSVVVWSLCKPANRQVFIFEILYKALCNFASHSVAVCFLYQELPIWAVKGSCVSDFLQSENQFIYIEKDTIYKYKEKNTLS